LYSHRVRRYDRQAVPGIVYDEPSKFSNPDWPVSATLAVAARPNSSLANCLTSDGKSFDVAITSTGGSKDKPKNVGLQGDSEVPGRTEFLVKIL